MKTKTKKVMAYSCSAAFAGYKNKATDPVFVLPADAQSYDRMVEQGARAIHERDKKAKLYSARRSLEASPRFHILNCKERAVAALASLNITRPKETKA